MYISIKFSGMDAGGFNFNAVPKYKKKMRDATVLIFAR